MRILCIIIFLAVFCTSAAQEKLEIVDLQSINTQVAKLAAEKDYKGVLLELDKINVNDTAYVSSLVSKSYYLMALDRHQDAVDSLKKGLSLSKTDIRSSLYQNMGVSYFKQEKYEQALEALDEGLRVYPLNHSLLYNKAVVLETQGKLKEAVNLLERAITINPYYTSAFIKLGSIYYKQERPAQALMAYNLALILDPDGVNAFARLQGVNEMFRNANENKRTPGLELSPDDNSFEDLNLILSNRIALNAEYETGNELNFPLIKQNHALLSQIISIEGNRGFWDTKFLPFFKWIAETENFDNWTYTISYSIEKEDFQKVVKKKTAEIKEFIGKSFPKWTSILSDNNTSPIDGQVVDFNYEGDPLYTSALGKINANGKQEGPWFYFNNSGRLTAKGSFNDQGQRTGEWKWFNEQSKIKEINQFVDGTIQNSVTTYFPNGQLNIKGNYKDGELDGEYLRYNEKGALKEKKSFKNGELSGTYISYFDVGELLPEFVIEYNQNKVQDTAKEYQSTQHIYALMPFKNGVKDGLERYYFLNDSLASEYNYKEGKLQGPFTIYFDNGTIYERGSYTNDLYEGPYKSWYSDGTLEIEAFYEEGELEGSYTYYDTDGKKYYNYTYKKGDVIDYRYFNKDGSLLVEGKRRGGEFFYTGYSPYGIKISEGLYDVEGGKKGEWKFYHNSGYLTSKGFFENDLTQGVYTGYYPDGSVEWEGNYVDNDLSGYYVNYYPNGKIMSQGGYKDGYEQGEWHNYYLDGTLKAINFYHKGQLHGKQKDFTVNQKLAKVNYFEFGDLKKTHVYNKNGDVVEELILKPAADTTLITRHYNSEKYYEITYKYGIKHGPAFTYFFDGSVSNHGSYYNGEMHGKWSYYNEDGSLQMELNYVLGQLDGKFTRYFRNGQIEDDYFYHFDNPQGEWRSFYEDGTLNTITHHLEGKEHGRKEFYSPEGKLQIIRFYNHGTLVGYSYLDTNGQELPMISIKNQTAEIKSYYDNGQLARKMTYRNGFLEGEYKVYSYNGQILEDFKNHNDEYQGPKISYYLNGQVKELKTYSYGKLDGEYVSYYENGKIKEKNQFRNDVSIGPREVYDENGTKIKTQKFFNNEVYEQQTF